MIAFKCGVVKLDAVGGGPTRNGRGPLLSSKSDRKNYDGLWGPPRCICDITSCKKLHDDDWLIMAH